MKEEKKFIIPTIEIIEFTNDDIIANASDTDVNGEEIEKLA